MEQVSVTGWEGGNNHWFRVAWGKWWEWSWVRLFWSYSSKRQVTRGVFGRSHSLLKHSYVAFLKECSLDLLELDGRPGETLKTHHPSYSLSRELSTYGMSRLSTVLVQPWKQPIHNAAFSCSSSASSPGTYSSFSGHLHSNRQCKNQLIAKPLLQTSTEPSVSYGVT